MYMYMHVTRIFHSNNILFKCISHIIQNIYDYSSHMVYVHLETMNIIILFDVFPKRPVRRLVACSPLCVIENLRLGVNN